MEYLLLVFLGLVIAKYIIPVLDVLLELVNYWIARFVGRIMIDTQREQYMFKKEVEADNNDTSPRIGFNYEELISEDEEFEDEVDEESEEVEEKKNILGLIKKTLTSKKSIIAKKIKTKK